MDSERLIRQYKLFDIISLDDIYYALASVPISVPGCTTITTNQIHIHLHDFLTKGYSHKHRKPYSQLANMAAWTLFTYNLTDLKPVKKQTFSHALAGTAGRQGLLSQWHGQKIGKSAFFVPNEYHDDAAAFLNHWNTAYTTEVVLRG